MSEPTVARAISWRGFCGWLAAGAVAVLVLSVTATYAPPAFRRLVLSHAVFGGACGYVLAWLATEFRLTVTRKMITVSMLLTCLGGVNLAWLSYREFRAVRQAVALKHAEDLAALNMLESLGTADPEAAARYAAERRKYAPRLTDYLRHRVSALGGWPIWGAVVFWMGELVIASITAGGCARWARNTTGIPLATHHVDQSGTAQQ